MLIEKSAPTVFTRLEDSTAVLLNLGSRAYYDLNRTGAFVWQQIEKWQVLTLDDLIRAAQEQFEVSEDEARRHLKSFLERLEQLKLVHLG
ncbi:MAG: PqqD family protein [Acidobacteriota bacterium]